MLSFKELAESGSEEGEEKPGACGFTQELQPTDDTGKTLLLNEFIAVSRVLSFVRVRLIVCLNEGLQFSTVPSK